MRPRPATNFKDFNPNSMTNKYVGSNRKNWFSWLIKADLNKDTLTFECKDYEKNSILLTNEYIVSAFEFGEGSLVIHVAETDVLLVKEWKVVKVIKEKDPANVSKYWFQPLPFFHPEEFPFIVCSGTKSFNLINLHTGKM